MQATEEFSSEFTDDISLCNTIPIYSDLNKI